VSETLLFKPIPLSNKIQYPITSEKTQSRHSSRRILRFQ